MKIKAFQELNLIRKTPVIAKIGGFRPDPAAHSWFGGHFFIHKNRWVWRIYSISTPSSTRRIHAANRLRRKTSVHDW